jgi:hypothetical protein|tara:strand:+ start:481 stop:792 length:312 start_codon:yes stop_codon:yes gene_type:complete
MEDKDQPIIYYLLESEDYVSFDPAKHNKFHFNVARIVKDEIRAYKWIEAEKGRGLTWDIAVKEWMNYHYDDFIGAVIPKKRMINFIKKRSKDFVSLLKFLTIP